jgi:Golgi nucleoside diphosphatase
MNAACELWKAAGHWRGLLPLYALSGDFNAIRYYIHQVKNPHDCSGLSRQLMYRFEHCRKDTCAVNGDTVKLTNYQFATAESYPNLNSSQFKSKLCSGTL